MRKYFCLSSLLFCTISLCFCLPVKINYTGSGNYYLVERTNLRRYDNGKYIGLVSREVRSFISQQNNFDGKSQSDYSYDGNFYVTEETKHNSLEVKEGIYKAVPSSFYISKDGTLVMTKDNGYPSFRSFPSFTQKNILPGDVWEAEAERAVDPLNKNIFTKIPMNIQYTFVGEETYHEQNVYKIKAEWATRYGITYWDFGGDLELKNATGFHKATILVNKKTGNSILVNDLVDETFVYKDGNKYQFKGTIILFTEYPPAVDKEKIITSLQRVALVDDKNKADDIASSDKTKNENTSVKQNKSGTNNNSSKITDNSTIEQKTSNNNTNDLKNKTDEKIVPEDIDSINKNLTQERKITVEKTNAGLKLTIENLLFKPNSAELLEEESDRLDKIASVLKQVPKSMLLIEGHTAAIGTTEGEQELSEERAFKIAKELITRGIPKENIMCKGSGRTKPVASNETAEGRAKNRRVEITILE